MVDSTVNRGATRAIGYIRFACHPLNNYSAPCGHAKQSRGENADL